MLLYFLTSSQCSSTPLSTSAHVLAYFTGSQYSTQLLRSAHVPLTSLDASTVPHHYQVLLCLLTSLDPSTTQHHHQETPCLLTSMVPNKLTVLRSKPSVSVNADFTGSLCRIPFIACSSTASVPSSQHKRSGQVDDQQKSLL